MFGQKIIHTQSCSQDINNNFLLMLWGNNLWRPYFFSARLNECVYLDFFNVIQELLYASGYQAKLVIHVRWCSASFSFWNVLKQRLRKPMDKTSKPIAWPPRFPNLNLLDFYFWSHLKSIVYSTPVNNVDNLREKIRNKFKTIWRISNIFEQMRNSMLRRAVAYVDEADISNIFFNHP